MDEGEINEVSGNVKSLIDLSSYNLKVWPMAVTALIIYFFSCEK